MINVKNTYTLHKTPKI